MILAAFLVTQVLPVAAFRQGMMICLFMCFAISFVYFAQINFSFIGIPIKSLPSDIFDIFAGSILGIALNSFVLPGKFYNEFRQGIAPLLQVLEEYSEHLLLYFKTNDQQKYLNELNLSKMKIEKSMQQYSIYPEWVYAYGFNPGLRSGFRFFLINLEKIIELFFVWHIFFTKKFQTDLLEKIRVEIVLSLEKNKELMQLLNQYFAGQKPTENPSDYFTDISELESAFRKLVPPNLELLDISPDYIVLTELIRNIKDSRKLLLDLVSSLP